jgi:tRNA uridine 5-carboxymethylaminomethyl modification enzyme
MYIQGLSTSLPVDVQEAYIKTVIGLEKAEIMRPGYAIEYDFAPPTQLYPWLETRRVKNLFFAGQINGTSGYEEAGAQGLLAGINAVLKLDGKEPLVLRRDQGYIGVLIDDLATLGTLEPYRMFSSRCEYRLTMRQDNADERLTPIGYKIGLISESRYERFLSKMKRIEREVERLSKRWVKQAEAPVFSERLKTNIQPGASFSELLKRPELTYEMLREVDFIIAGETPAIPGEGFLSLDEAEEVEIRVKYEGYIKQQEELIEKFRKLEDLRIPEDIDYNKFPSLRSEAKEKLSRIRPGSIGQASRISGVTPSDVSLLMIYLKK